MSALGQHVAVTIGLLLLGAIHGAIRRGVDALERSATAAEKASDVVVQAADAERRCPDYPPAP